MPKQMLRMSKFQGVNVDVDETLLSNAELRKADNAEIIDDGKLAKAQGTEFVNSTSFEGKCIQMFEWARDDGTVLRFGRVYKEIDGFGSVSLVRIFDDGTTETIYETSVEIKSNFAAEFTKGYETAPDLTICGVMQNDEVTGLTLDPGYNNITDIVNDGTYLYLLLKISYYNMTILKLDIATLTVQSFYSLTGSKPEGSNLIGTENTTDYSKLALCNGYLFVVFIGYRAGGVGGGRIIKIDPSVMVFVNELLLEQNFYDYLTSVVPLTVSKIEVIVIGDYLYVFTTKIFKINADTVTLEHTSDNLYSVRINYTPSYISAVKYDDDYFYMVLNTSPVQVYKVNRVSLAKEGTLTLSSGFNGCYGAALVVTDNVPYLYIGTNTAACKITKVNLNSMEVVNYKTLDTGVNYCRDIVYDSTNKVLYVAMYTSPGKVIVIDPSTLGVIGSLTLSDGQNYCNALQLINNILYIGLGTSPAQILPYSVTITYDSTYENIDAEKKRSGVFSLKDVLYLLTGKSYLQYTGSAVTEVAEETEDEEGGEVTDCDLDPIRACTMAVWHPSSFRCFFAGDGSNKLYYSERNDPRWVKKAGFTVPTTGDGPIKGLALFMDAVVVFFQRSAWVWNGQDPAIDVIWKRLPLTEGTESPATIECGTNQLEWLGTGSGYWAMAPAMIGATTIVNPAQSLLANLAEKKVTNYLKNIKNRDLACGAYDTRERKSYIAYCDDSSLGYCNKLLIRNTDIPGSFTLLPGQQIYDLLYTSTGELWIATENYIVKRYEHYKRALPDGTYGAITMDIKTPASVLGNPYREKWVHSLSVGFFNPGTGFELNIKLYVDDMAVFEETYITSDDDGNFVMARFTEIYDAIGTRFAVGITNSQAATKAVIYEIALQYSLVSNYGQSI
jgi:hypothetical protein